MPESSVAKRYAQALFELAEEGHAVLEVRQDLHDLAQLAKNDPSFQRFIANPLIPAHKRNDVISSLTGSIHALTERCLHFIAGKKRFSKLPDICQAFETIYNESKNILNVQVSMAHEPSAQQIEGIKEKLAKRFNKEIITEVDVNPDLVGGFKLQVQNEIYDYTVVNKLETFRKQALNA